MRTVLIVAALAASLGGAVACYNHNVPGPVGPNDPNDPTRPDPPFGLGPTYPFSPLNPAPMMIKGDGGAPDAGRD